MEHSNVRSFMLGVGAYVICLLPVVLPIFRPTPAIEAELRLFLGAGLALVLTALVMLTAFDAKLGDPEARFLQGLMGIGICAGFYSYLAPTAQPQIVLMTMIWIALGLTRLKAWQVAVLTAVHLSIYLNAFAGSLMNPADPLHANAIYTLFEALALGAFMYLRAHEYERARQERQILQDENAMQAAALEDAREHIHTITARDMDTIALKFPFFKEELRSCKQRADASETSFWAGLISIDHFSELSARYDEDVVKQLVRAVTERAAGVIQELQLGELDPKRPPIGRVGDGLYGMILSRANLKGAETCARKLRQAVELHSIKTAAGLVNLTLTVGLIEYHPGETVDELLTSMGRALENGRLHKLDEEVQAAKPKQDLQPIKAARGTSDLRLLHYKEYDAPVH